MFLNTDKTQKAINVLLSHIFSPCQKNTMRLTELEWCPRANLGSVDDHEIKTDDKKVFSVALGFALPFPCFTHFYFYGYFLEEVNDG